MAPKFSHTYATRIYDARQSSAHKEIHYSYLNYLAQHFGCGLEHVQVDTRCRSGELHYYLARRASRPPGKQSPPWELHVFLGELDRPHYRFTPLPVGTFQSRLITKRTFLKAAMEKLKPGETADTQAVWAWLDRCWMAAERQRLLTGLPTGSVLRFEPPLKCNGVQEQTLTTLDSGQYAGRSGRHYTINNLHFSPFEVIHYGDAP